jgi:Tol biopolymer transport system component
MKKVYALIVIIVLCISCSAPLSEEKAQSAVVDTPITPPASYIPSTPTFTPSLKPSATSTATPMATNSPTATLTPSITLTPTSEIKPSQPHNLLAFLYFREIMPYGDLWTVADDGTNLQQITDIGKVYSFTWSPDGKKIALLLSDDNDIYIINADGSNLTKLTTGVEAFGPIDWRGSKIAFLRELNSPYIKISYVDMSKTSHTVIDISPEIENLGIGLNPLWGVGLRWSPNGEWIVLNHGLASGIASSDGSVFLDELFINPRWKNDSSLIISPVLPPDMGIKYYNPNTNKNGFLSSVNNHVAVYSPDDKYIIYCNDNAIMRMTTDGTQQTVLARVKATDPVWDSVGDKIAYVSYELIENPMLTGIFIINSDGSNPIQVISGWVESPQWQP